MKPQKSTSLIKAAICSFLMIAVGTELISPTATLEHRQNKYVPWDNVFVNPRRLTLPQRNLPPKAPSRGDVIFRIRRSDYAEGNVEAALSDGARYIINASPTSQPIMFFDDSKSESHEVKNSMLIIKKKKKKPPEVTVFTHSSATSEEEPLLNDSKESEDAMSTHIYHKPWKLKTTLTPPMYHYFNSGSMVEKYHATETPRPQNPNLGILGSVWRRTTKTPGAINNHHPGGYVKPRPTPSPTSTQIIKHETENSAVVWRQPTTKMPSSGIISNHNPGPKGEPPWKKPSYSSEHSMKSTYHGLKKPSYVEQASSTTAQPMQLTTKRPHRFSESPMTVTHSVKKTISPYFTSTTQRAYSDEFSSTSYDSKGPTQRPSSNKIKMPSDVLPPTTTSHPVKKPVFEEEQDQEEIISQINNHKLFSSEMLKHRKPLLTSKPHFPSGQVAIVDKHQETATDILGERIKLPETVRSKLITVIDAPPDRATTIRHNKLIVLQKRMDKFPQVTLSPPFHDQVTTTVVVTSEPILALTTKNVKTVTTKPTPVAQKPIKTPDKEKFPVAPVMDPWSNVPIPSAPSWAVSSTTRAPSLASPSGSSFFPGIPFIPFLSSLISPLLSSSLFNRPLTPSSLNTGMQGIKAMQGFLRNSLMGAMFCFLPSALIAMTMSATQRAELRKIPEMNEMMVFCKKCLENLKNMEKSDTHDEPDWVQNL